MKEDEYGFLYPEIDYKKCIRCGRCNKVCAYQTREENSTAKETYVAMGKDEDILRKSASGGIFATVATKVLEKGGVVAGCSLEQKGNILSPEHIMIESVDDLEKLQGSKYVQSSMGAIFKTIKEELEKSRLVLFSGTPCQVAALKNFLGNREYSNLFTIDIICHGTPSAKMFQDYLSELSRSVRGKIAGFKFRDKAEGWGLKGSVEYLDNKGRKKKKMIPVKLSSYYRTFLHSDTYRENCYSCKYAGPYRPGDLTIGDYWGIEKEHSEYLSSNGGSIDEKRGVSCILVNNEQGKRMLDEFGSELKLLPSSFEKAARQNEQLNNPSKKGNEREKVLELYKNGGYPAVESWYYRKLGIKRYIYEFRNIFSR